MTQASGHTRTSITLDDFMTGLLAGLAQRGIRVVSIRGPAFYRAVEKVFIKLDHLAEEKNLGLRFWITRNRVYGDSADVREGIAKAVQRDLISLDNPEYQDMRLKIGPEDAGDYLSTLPGGAKLYEQLAETFLDVYPALVENR